MRAFLTNLPLVFALMGVTPAIADGQDECSQILATPKFTKILRGTDGYSVAHIASDHDGQELLGKTCSIEALVAFFEAGGWKHTGLQKGAARGPFGGGVGFYYDTILVFCLEGRSLFTFYLKSCIQQTGVKLLTGQITHINSGAVK